MKWYTSKWITEAKQNKKLNKHNTKSKLKEKVLTTLRNTQKINTSIQVLCKEAPEQDKSTTKFEHWILCTTTQSSNLPPQQWRPPSPPGSCQKKARICQKVSLDGYPAKRGIRDPPRNFVAFVIEVGNVLISIFSCLHIVPVDIATSAVKSIGCLRFGQTISAISCNTS